MGLTDQELLTLGPAKIFVTKRHVLIMTAFCVRICRAWRRLSGLLYSSYYYYYLVFILPISFRWLSSS